MDRLDIFVISLSAVIAAILTLAIYANIKRNKRLANLWSNYQKALAFGDKQKALAAGRIYYAAFRRGAQIRAADEVALSNDINAMR
jgi:hypothetical protein